MIRKILKHPLTILLSVLVGTLIGVFNKDISQVLGVTDFAGILSVIGDMYLFFLQMTVIPIIMTAIASSLAKLIENRSVGLSLQKIFMVYMFGILFVALVGVGLGVIGKPGSGMDEQTKSLLGSVLRQSDQNTNNAALEMTLSRTDSSGSVKPSLLVTFFKDLIPSNIFYSLSFGSTLAIVFFSIIFGIAVGSLKKESSRYITTLFSAVFEAFQRLISWSLYFLPVGLVCLLSGQISRVGVTIFMAMSQFILLFFAAGLIIFLAGTLAIWLRSGIKNPFHVIALVFHPILIALATRNSLAALPTAINVLEKKLNFESTSVNLTLPLGMTLGRFGNILYFGLAALFVVQVYDVQLFPGQYLMVLFGIIFAGIATAGASGIVTLSVINIVLSPLNLPIEAVLVIFMAIDPIIDPIRTFMIVYFNMATTVMIAPRNSSNDLEPVAN